MLSGASCLPSSIIWYRCTSQGGNGRLWKWCGLPSMILLGVSPLPAQGHGNGDNHRTWHCIVNVTDTDTDTDILFAHLRPYSRIVDNIQ